MNIHLYTQKYIYTYIYIHVYLSISISMYVYTHTYIHTYIYTHIYRERDIIYSSPPAGKTAAAGFGQLPRTQAVRLASRRPHGSAHQPQGRSPKRITQCFVRKYRYRYRYTHTHMYIHTQCISLEEGWVAVSNASFLLQETRFRAASE